MLRSTVPRRYFLLVTCAVLVTCADCTAQTSTPADFKPPVLEVISVKPNKATDNNGAFGARPDGIYAQNVSLRFLLTLAFQRQFGKGQMIGVPAWVDADHFDMLAKVTEADITKLKGLSGGPLTMMRSELLQTVLRERFLLKTHIEVREGAVYELVASKGGPKIKPSPRDDKSDMPSPSGALVPGASLAIHGEIAGHDVPFSRLVESLLSDGQLDRVVIDRTGFTGKYDYLLTWKPDQAAPDANDGATGDNNLPSIFTAIQEQLGLRLEPAKGPIRTLVIDHVEKPSEN